MESKSELGVQHKKSHRRNEERVREFELEARRPLLAPGHVFAMDDVMRLGHLGKKRHRPVVLVVVPPLSVRAELALQQRVSVSARLSWKPEWGLPPESHEAEVRLQNKGWLFSPRGSLGAFNKDGIFELGFRYPVKVLDLIRCVSLGWLPRETIIALCAHAGSRLPDRYPPNVG